MRFLSEKQAIFGTLALLYSTAFFAVKSDLFPTNNLFTFSLA